MISRCGGSCAALAARRDRVDLHLGQISGVEGIPSLHPRRAEHRILLGDLVHALQQARSRRSGRLTPRSYGRARSGRRAPRRWGRTRAAEDQEQAHGHGAGRTSPRTAPQSPPAGAAAVRRRRCLATGVDVVGHDHLAHLGLAIRGHEHVLSAAQPRCPLRPARGGRAGHPAGSRRWRVRPSAAAHRPLQRLLEVLVHLRLHKRRHIVGGHGALRAVDGDVARRPR